MNRLPIASLLLVPIALSALPACGPAPAPASPPPPASPTSVVNPASPPPAAGAPEPVADAKPTATVSAVAPAKDAKGLRARIVFSNPSKRACRVLGYKASWGTRNKAVTLQDLTLPPGETRDRWLKVAPDDGDLDALTVEGTRVELTVECPTS